MLLSMTGYGEARSQDERRTVEVEVRSVNNRHLKASIRLSEPYSAFEPEVERLIRESVRRGTVHLSVRVERPRTPEDYRLNLVALRSYRDQLQALGDGPVDPAALLGLPGVVEDARGRPGDVESEWPEIARVIGEALGQFSESRAAEGRAMAESLEALGRAIGREVEEIDGRRGDVAGAYRERLLERVRALLREQGVTLEASQVIREVALFADRSDITEEVVRLRAHLAQFLGLLSGGEGAGRKLEFLVQEMGREANTIGSKASDVGISRSVVEVKAAMESIRELIQNIE